MAWFLYGFSVCFLGLSFSVFLGVVVGKTFFLSSLRVCLMFLGGLYPELEVLKRSYARL